MFQSSLMFIAPENTSQATPSSPPAVAPPVKPLVQYRKNIKFGFSVLGNTVGFGAVLAGCWFSVQLMQVFLPAA